MTPFVSLAILITVLLTIASLFIYYQIAQHPTAERHKNKQRLIVWWIIFLSSLVLFQLGLIAVTLIIYGLLCWTISEVFDLFDKQIKPFHLFLLCLLVFVLSLSVLRYPDQSVLILLVALIGALLMCYVSITSSLFVPIVCLYLCFSLFSILLIVQLAQQSSLDYSYLLLMLFFITSVNDIAQYITGSMFGKTPIAQRLSPNKTVAGLWGGILVSSIISITLLPRLISISMLEAFAIGSILALIGFFGDLIISKLKRGLQVKDSGRSIMGHGGILDRIDSLLLTAPTFGIILYFKEYL